MKNIYFFLIAFLFHFSQLAQGQCPPPGFPNSGNTCPQAPILCENLDGYCNTINNNNVQQNFPGCPANVLNNDEWFAFFAGSNFIQIQVTPSNCSQSGQMGLQGGIYSSCTNMAQNIMDVQCPCTTQPFILQSGNFVIGQVYWFVLDGCAGNVCDYSIDVLQGSTVGVPPVNPGAVTGPINVCPGNNTNYTLPLVTGATIYTWTVTPALGTVTNTNNNATVTWGSTAGTADVCVTTSNACYSNPTPSCISVTVNPTPTATLSGSGVICQSSPAPVNLTVTFTGTAPWTFIYTIGGTPQTPITTSTNPYTLVVNQPGNIGLQSVTSGPVNCPGTVSGTVNIPSITITPTATTTPASCGSGNGAIDLSVSGGNTPYMYNWSNGQTTQDLSNIIAGTYTVTVTDANNCTGTASVTVADVPNNPNLSSTTTATTCEQANGSINLTVSGGVSPFTFNWSNGATTEDLNNILAGSYTVTVTGSNGCTATATITVSNNNPPINITGTTNANTSCNSGNGSISINVSPASPPGGGSYTYTWSNGASGTSLNNLAPGTYTVTVNGGGACTQTASFTVPDQPNTPTLSSTVTPENCGLSNGGATINASGGVSPYTYNWSNGNTTNSISNVPGGSYTVTVTGANGCTSTSTINIPDNLISFTITGNVTANTSCNSSNGGIIITLNPPVPVPLPGYTYTWSNGNMTTTLTNLAPGTYTVTVSAGGTCTQTASFTVPNTPSTPVLSSNVVPSTCNLSNGSATVNASGGVAPYTFMWSNGNNGQVLSNVLAGTYTVTVTGANGCSSVGSVNIPNNNPQMTINGTVTPNTFCVGGNGAIQISVTPPGNLTYQWSNGNTSTSLSNLLPGSYSVTVSAGGTCMETASFTVPDNSSFPNLSFLATPSICNLSNGSIDLVVSGGLSPLTYSWSNGMTSEDINNVLAGIYSVTVTGSPAGGACTASTTINIPNNNVTFSVTGLVTGNSSCGLPNGQVIVDVQPPGSYTFSWGNGSTDPFLVSAAPGNYSVTVSAGGTCTQAATFNVYDLAFPPNISTSTTPSICGGNNGSANITVTSGQTPYSFNWSNGTSTEDLNGVAAGNYTVTVTGGNGCSATASVNITNNNTALNITGTPTANTSCSASNGAININVSPSGNYTYNWSNGFTTEDLSNLAAGPYSVTVSAGGSCTSTASFTVTNNTLNPVISENVTAAICGASNGAIDLSVSGGSTPYTFQWSNSASSEDLSDVPSGDYSVTVTNGNGCTATATINIPNNSSTFSLSGTPQPLTSCTSPNGAVNLTISPPGTYGIIWSNAATTEDINNLPAGTYTVTVTESGSCTASASYTVVNQTSFPSLTQSVTEENCDLNNGSIDLTVTGGATPYTFTWSNTASSEDLTGISTGTYAVTVTGANGCTAITSATVPDNSVSLSIDGTTAANTSCGINNGGIDLTVAPPGAYTFQWSNSATTEDLNGIPGGSYAVTVSAGGSCTSSANFTVPTTTSDPVVSQNVTPAVCGQTNGAIDLVVNGGQTPYSFNWSNGAITEDLTSIPSGSYSVTVTGANSCNAIANITVLDNTTNFSLSGVPVANTLCGGANGSINLTVSPAGSYTYIWSNSGTTEDLSNIPAGAYSVTVTEGISCSSSASFTVSNNTTAPSLAPSVTPSFCGAADGAIDLNITGGVMPYTILWSNGADTEVLTDILAGSYDVTVTGADGCDVSSSLTVTDDVINFSLTATTSANTLCFGTDGAIDLNVNPPGSYTITWSNNETTEDIGGLSAGNYTVTVSGGATCEATSSFTVDNNSPAPAITGSVADIACFGGNDGAINLNINGGISPYTYNWSPTIPGNPQNPSNLTAGTYSVTVTDDSGCFGTASFSIQQPASSVQIACSQESTVSLPGASDGEASVNISGGTAPYTINWSPGGSQVGAGAGIFTIGNLAEGGYSVTVQDVNGCEITCGFNITTLDCVTALGMMQTGPLSLCGDGCQTANYDDTGQYLDNDDLLQFVLHTGNSNVIVGEIARNTVPTFCFDQSAMSFGTTYYISAVAGNDDGSGNVDLADDCTKISIGTPIVFIEIPVATAFAPDPIDCAVPQVGVSGTSSISASTFSWTASGGGQIIGNGNQANIQVGASGFYSLIVTANGCKDTTTIEVLDITNDIVAFITATPAEILDCTVTSVFLNGSATGTSNPLFIWVNSDVIVSNENPLLVDYSGFFDLVVLDTITACSDTASIEIVDGSIYPPLFVNTPPQLNCKDTVVTISGGSPVAGLVFQWAIINGTDTTIVGAGSSAQVTSTGTYYLIGTDPNNGCQNALPVNVTGNITLPTVDAGQNQTLDCYQTPVDLTGTASPANVTILWTANDPNIVISNPGTLNITVDEAGVYTLTVQRPDNFCTASDTVVVTQYENEPQADLTNSPPSCFGFKDGSIYAEVDPANAPYQFRLNGVNYGGTQFFPGLAAGSYHLEVIDNQGCVWETDIYLQEPDSLFVELGTNLVVELGDPVTLHAEISVPLSQLDTILWTPFELFPCPAMPCDVQTIFPLQQTSVGITVIDTSGCKANDILALFVKKTREVFIPNSFSPNGDGVNDIFMIFSGAEVVRIKDFLVFDRWGETVYQYHNFYPNDPAYGWDGNHRGKPMNPQVLVYFAIVEFIDGSEKLFEGDVTLVR